MWPISCRELQRGTASLPLMKPEPVSDYLAEYMTVSMILILTITGALSFDGGSFYLIGGGFFQSEEQTTVERVSFGFIYIIGI